MYRFEQSQDTRIVGAVTPKLSVAWSRLRAWHGETVTIQVRSELVTDGLEVQLQLRGGTGEGAIATRLFDDQTLTITGNALDQQYKIDWSGKNFKETPSEFTIRATVPSLKVTSDSVLTADSAPMAVDLAIPIFSA